MARAARLALPGQEGPSALAAKVGEAGADRLLASAESWRSRHDRSQALARRTGEAEQGRPPALAALPAPNSRHKDPPAFCLVGRGNTASSEPRRGTKTPGPWRGVRNSRPRRCRNKVGCSRSSSRESPSCPNSRSASSTPRRSSAIFAARAPILRHTRHNRADRRWPAPCNRRPSPPPESIRSIAWLSLLLCQCLSGFLRSCIFGQDEGLEATQLDAN